MVNDIKFIIDALTGNKCGMGWSVNTRKIITQRKMMTEKGLGSLKASIT